jgi:hypothetical protein
MGIYKKLFEIQKSTRGFKKDKRGSNYEYVSGEKILNHIRAQMDELGVLLKQEILSIENERQDYTTRNGSRSEILSKVQMRFTWVDVETEDKDENLFGANGQNDWDKGVGSALTYAERYFILKYFHIPTDEDDIDALPPKDSPTDEDDKPKLKPLNDKAFNAALARINKGEKLVENIKKEFNPTAAQLATLVSAETSYKHK